jgi:hypothetical protein
MRLLVLAPLGISAGAAALLLATAPLAWGAADGVDMPSWLPATTALLVGLPVLSISSWGLVSVWQRLSGLFLVDVIVAAIGGFAHWFAAICLVILAGSIGTEQAYTSISGESMSTAGFLLLAFTATAVACSLLGGLTMVYVWSVTPGATIRVGERREDEVDFIAEWGRRRHRGGGG